MGYKRHNSQSLSGPFLHKIVEIGHAFFFLRNWQTLGKHQTENCEIMYQPHEGWEHSIRMTVGKIKQRGPIHTQFKLA